MTELPKPNTTLLADLFEGEKIYPIYEIEIKWSMDIQDGDRHAHFSHNLPEGRMWNSIDWYEMPKEPHHGLADEALILWWPQCKYRGENPSEPIATATFKRWEVWCLSWFSHWTYDLNFNDDQVLCSFRNYVARAQRESYCLMGAEDRGCWYGRTTGHLNDEYTDPPCRCPCCKERGVIAIDH